MSLKNLLSQFANRKTCPSMRPMDLPDPVLEGLPDFVEPLLGWRAWKVWASPDRPGSCPAFSSIILDTPWLPHRKVEAEHSFDLGAKCLGLLDLGCSCGVYAFTDPVEAFCYLTRVRDRLAGVSVEVALGTVSLWGRAVECERGYKAQYAYPRHIYLPPTFARYLSLVSSSFGVPVGIYASNCEEEPTLDVSLQLAGRERRRLSLRNSRFLNHSSLPSTIGFYDLAPSAAGEDRIPAAGSDFRQPDSGFPDRPADAPWS